MKQLKRVFFRKIYELSLFLSLAIITWVPILWAIWDWMWTIE